jgi:hypothetical protein
VEEAGLSALVAGFDQERLQMTCTGKGQCALCRIEDSKDHGDEAGGWKIVDEQSIEPLQHFSWGAAGLGE